MLRHFLRPRWLAFHLLVVAGVVLMVVLGFWQLDRLSERHDFNDRVGSRIDAAPVAIESAVPTAAPVAVADLEWTPVLATGAYLPEDTVLVANRSQDGLAGRNVVTPLRLDDGRLLLVNRGFVPLAADVPEAPSGVITVQGVLRASQGRTLGGARDPAEGALREVQRIDTDRLAAQMPGDVVPVWLSLQASDPAEGPIPAPLPRPVLSSGPHLGYAVQWFIFAACVAIGWVLAVRRSARTYATVSPEPPAPPSA